MLCLAFLVLALGLEPLGEALTLEIRVFAGMEDVTRQSRVTVHRAGEREQPVARFGVTEAAVARVPPGLYDVQVLREVDGRIVSIRWAQRLVVMPYPDEEGRHLEVINLESGFGALQIRGPGIEPRSVDVALFPAGERESPVPPADAASYILFVAPAGPYDVRVTRGVRTVWHEGIQVPRERTRLWLLP